MPNFEGARALASGLQLPAQERARSEILAQAADVGRLLASLLKLAKD